MDLHHNCVYIHLILLMVSLLQSYDSFILSKLNNIGFRWQWWHCSSHDCQLYHDHCCGDAVDGWSFTPTRSVFARGEPERSLMVLQARPDPNWEIWPWGNFPLLMTSLREGVSCIPEIFTKPLKEKLDKKNHSTCLFQVRFLLFGLFLGCIPFRWPAASPNQSQAA